jgi:ADP-ribose pyrophosphatase
VIVLNLTEKKIDGQTVFKGKIIDVKVDNVLLPNGNKAKREVVVHRGGVCVLPLTDNGEILMVRQFRYAYQKELLEIPAGKKDSIDEDPLECGKRELKEETGAIAKEYIFLGELYPSPGFTNEIIYMYMARGLSYGDTNPDDDEFLQIEKVPFKKALEMVLDGSIKDAKTQCAILKANSILNK